MEIIADPSQSSTEILHALESVTAHELFVRADRLRAFLSYVVKQTLAGREEELKEYVIGLEVYGKGGDYDTRLDAAVRVDARRLREKLRVYYSTAGASDAIRIEVPKGTYAPVFYRSCNTGSEPQRDVEPSGQSPNMPFHWRVGASLALASGMLILALFWVNTRTTASASAQSLEPDGLTTRARHLARRRTPESLERAIFYAGQAARRTPGDPRSHAVLADAYLSLATFDRSNEQQLVRKSVESARQSLALNPSDADSTTVLATVEMEKGNWSRAQSLFEAALAKEPNKSSLHARYARLLSMQALHTEAIEHAKTAVLHDSLNVAAWASLAQAHMYARDYVSALRAMERGLEIDPAFDNGHLLCARLNILLVRHADARRHLSAVSPAGQRRPEHLIAQAWLLARERNQAAALAAIRSADGASSVGTATAYAALGQNTEAMNVLQAAVKAGDRNLVYLKVSPGLDPLRSDPQLESLCEQVRLSGCTLP